MSSINWIWRQVDIDYFNMCNKPFPEDYQDRIEGMSFYETAIYFKNRFAIEDSIEEIMECWNTMAFEKYQNEVLLKEGAL